MTFKIKVNGETREYEKKTSLLDILGDKDPDKKYIVAKVNNRVRELTYEVYYDADVEFLTVKDRDSIKTYEASLRYIVSMAFKRCYPELKIRLAYNVSRCLSIHLLTPGYVANTAMLLRINHEIDSIVKADFPLKRMVVSNEEASRIYEELGYQDKLALLQYRPEKTVHLYECDG